MSAKPHQGRKLMAGHTRTSLLRTLSSSGRFSPNEWLLPETAKLFEQQSARQRQLAERSDQEAKRRKRRQQLTKLYESSTRQWLKKHGLVASRLTILDALAPTMVPHRSKYIPILDKHVLARVFDEILPFAHLSGDSKNRIHLVNPSAVNLKEYEEKLKKALDKYRQRLDTMVWNVLPEDVKKEFDTKEPVPFSEHRSKFLKVLNDEKWPVSEADITALEQEIEKGEKFLQQSKDLRRAASEAVPDLSEPSTARSFLGQNVDGVLPVEEEQTTCHTAHLGNKKDLQSTSDDSSISPVDTTLHLPGSPRAHPPDDSIPHSPEISKSHQTDCLKSSKASIAHSVNSNRRQPDLNVSNNANFSKAAESHSQTQTNAAGALRKSVSGPAKGPLLARSLRGTRVVARNNKDGLYYLGTVLKCPNVRQATVQFSDGCQKVLTRFILPLSGAVTCPPLSVGDYVLVQVVNLERNSDCFVPGIIHSPPKTRRVQLQFHTVMLYNGQEVTTLRLYLVKISKERFEFTVRYTAAMEGKTRKKVDVPAAKGKKRQRRKYIENHRRYSHSSESSHSDTSTHSKSDTGSPSSSKSSSPETRPRSPTPGIGRRPLSSSPARSPDAGQETHNDTPVSDRRSELQRLKQQLEKQQEQRRKQRKKLQKMKKKIRQMKLELPSKTEHGIQTSSDEQEKEVIITPPILQLRRSLPKLQPAEEVLARFTDDGWYYRGSVQQDLGDLSYIVEDATGFIERIWREDIISDYDDKAPVLKEQDKVIAQHPLYSNSYGPGCVLSVDEVLQTAVIKFYDGHESTIPRVEVYHLPAAIKYNHDVLHIQECQQSMLGLSVIARDDSNGEYYPGQITALEKGGQQYVIRWSDGSKSKQLPVHIFSAKTRRQRLLIGDRILALADPDQVVFLPGQITGAHAWGLIVRFCDGQVRDDVSALFCYWLTQGYFEEASYFWNLNHPDFGRKP